MNTASRAGTAILCVLMLIFIAVALAICRVITISFSVLAVLAAVCGLLGLVLVALSARRGGSRVQKGMLILAGISAAGMPISAILHNLVYGLFIAWFGEGIWGSGGDEPVFFLVAILVFPVLFVASAAAAAVLLLRERIAGSRNARPREAAG